MHPDEIRVARRDVGLRKIAQRLSEPAAEREGEQWTTVTHALRGTLYSTYSTPARLYPLRSEAMIEPHGILDDVGRKPRFWVRRYRYGWYAATARLELPI
jgi:hypothetical protein